METQLTLILTAILGTMFFWGLEIFINKWK